MNWLSIIGLCIKALSYAKALYQEWQAARQVKKQAALQTAQENVPITRNELEDALKNGKI